MPHLGRHGQWKISYNQKENMFKFRGGKQLDQKGTKSNQWLLDLVVNNPCKKQEVICLVPIKNKVIE